MLKSKLAVLITLLIDHTTGGMYLAWLHARVVTTRVDLNTKYRHWQNVVIVKRQISTVLCAVLLLECTVRRRKANTAIGNTALKLDYCAVRSSLAQFD